LPLAALMTSMVVVALRAARLGYSRDTSGSSRNDSVSLRSTGLMSSMRGITGVLHQVAGSREMITFWLDTVLPLRWFLAVHVCPLTFAGAVKSAEER
jgi:hypothetical protein